VARKIIVGIGEILWDVFGAEKHLGGAPANFAYHANALGDCGVTVSRIGRDQLGAEILDSLARLGTSTEHIQIDRRLSTGTVLVQLDAAGQPDFTISPDVAWDNIQSTKSLLRLARRADAVCYGTLAQRSPASRRTIRKFVAAAKKALVVCDLNLRGELMSLTSQDTNGVGLVADSIRMADVLKLNDGELRLLRSALRRGDGNRSFARWLIREFKLRVVCVTKGARGCVLHTARKREVSRGIKVKVVDTVGSGDAFTAAMVNRLLRRRPLREVAAFANRVGAYVASKPGATPPVELPRRRGV